MNSLPNCPPFQAILPAWFQSEAGQALVAQQVEAFNSLVPQQFYGLGCQFGLTEHAVLANFDVERCVYFDSAPLDSGNLNVVALPEALPLSDSSVDIAMMLHTLDYCDDPHQALREMAQIIRPEGVLVLTGFHPYSLWGLRRKLGPKTGPLEARFISRSSVQDWLGLLGFQSVAACVLNYQFAGLNAKWRQNLIAMDQMGDRWWPMLGAVYVLVVKKQIYSGLRLIGDEKRAVKWFPNMEPAQAKVAQQSTLNQ